MKAVLGISEAVWQELNLPQMQTHDLDMNTSTYTDAFIALDIFKMRYADYVRAVPRMERLFYQLVLALKAAKDKRAMERARQEADAERAAQEALGPAGARM